MFVSVYHIPALDGCIRTNFCGLHPLSINFPISWNFAVQMATTDDGKVMINIGGEDDEMAVDEAPAFPPGLHSAKAPIGTQRVIQAKESPASASAEAQAQAPAVEPKSIAEDGGASQHRDDANHAIEHVRSRPSSRPSTSASSPAVDLLPLPLNALSVADDPRLFTPPEKKYSKHRSFILSHKSEVLNQHFAMIDRELFLNLKFEELVSQDYVNTSQDLNALDWAQFLRERARMRAEGVRPSDLTLIRSRFNLMANFVASEIVLTNPGDRLMIHSKFVRIAWVSTWYHTVFTLG